MAKKAPKFVIPKASGGVSVVIDQAGLADFLETNPAVRGLLMAQGAAVASEAESTASAAENGAGGRIDGYAAAGFSVQWEARGGKRPRVNIVSNADPETVTRAHFYTQRRDGVAHLRAALYSVTGG